MKTIVVSITTDALFKATVDAKPLKFTGGEAQASVQGGQKHSLYWIVRGNAGTKYKVEIKSPPEAKFKYESVIDSDMTSDGIKRFTPNADNN